MHLKDFFKLGGLLIVLLAVLKVIFGQFLDVQNQIIVIAYWGLSAVITVAIIRRGGIMTYLEAAAVGVVWTIFSFLFDVFVTGSHFFLGFDMFKHLYIWIGYLVVIFSIFIFHKKRHVHIRRGGTIDSHH